MVIFQFAMLVYQGVMVAPCFEGTYTMLADDEDVLEISRLTGNKQYTDKTLGGRTRLDWTPKTR